MGSVVEKPWWDRGAEWPYALPRVNRKAKPIKPQGAEYRAMRKRIYERDNGQCHVCAARVPWAEFHAGHIIDRCRGGIDHDSNIVVMCGLCNDAKDPTPTRADYSRWLLTSRRRAKDAGSMVAVKWARMSEHDRACVRAGAFMTNNEVFEMPVFE